MLLEGYLRKTHPRECSQWVCSGQPCRSHRSRLLSSRADTLK